MTLGQMIDGLLPDAFVSIGSGNGYFFIGKAGEFRERAGSYDARFRRIARDNFIRQGGDPGKASEVPYTPVLEREVLDIYDRIIDPGKAVIIEGTETGGMWCYSERLDRRAGRSV